MIQSSGQLSAQFLLVVSLLRTDVYSNSKESKGCTTAWLGNPLARARSQSMFTKHRNTQLLHATFSNRCCDPNYRRAFNAKLKIHCHDSLWSLVNGSRARAHRPGWAISSGRPESPMWLAPRPNMV